MKAVETSRKQSEFQWIQPSGNENFKLEIRGITAYRERIMSRQFTDREMEILTLLSLGENYDEIANKLKLSLSTIRYHMSNLLLKLEVEDKAQAVAVGFRSGLIS